MFLCFYVFVFLCFCVCKFVRLYFCVFAFVMNVDGYSDKEERMWSKMYVCGGRQSSNV